MSSNDIYLLGIHRDTGKMVQSTTLLPDLQGGEERVRLYYPHIAVVGAVFAPLHVRGIIQDFQMRCLTAPTGSALTVDILAAGDANHPLSGGNEQTIFSGGNVLSISSGSKVMALKDAGHPWVLGASPLDEFLKGAYILPKFTSVGSGTPARDVFIEIGFRRTQG